ncbi:MAG: type II toxin-antitoxin system VapC family toxin [Planctomycetes bacterium]|nr:type II toxin-antitoxin system VapC family toxin [Planctomycetota bacterium]
MILDTCALLWLAGGGGKLSKAAARRIDAAPVVYVSAISGFEVGIKCRKGKLELPALPAEWFATVLEHHGLTVLPLGLDVCIRATELPAIHKDPCDRLIIASAELLKLPVATTDPRFKQYGIEVIS